MSLRNVPHPIPYQGSKRRLAPLILSVTPPYVRSLVEPFAGSAAMTLAAASKHLAGYYVLGDILTPLAALWELLINQPTLAANRYKHLWQGQHDDPPAHFLRVRQSFNQDRDPIKLLYLLARCVKNAVRFSPSGAFNQSADHRRQGMNPSKMTAHIHRAASLLKGRTTVRRADYRELLVDASSEDLIYMDPPYQGVSRGRDPRYYQQLDIDAFLTALDDLNRRHARYIISFDGSCGGRSYGSELTSELALTRIQIYAGRSSQATLAGHNHITIESLYLSRSLVQLLPSVPTALRVNDDPRQAGIET